MSRYFFLPDYQENYIFMRDGDTSPALEMELIKDSSGEYYDISSGTGYCLIRDSANAIFESGAVECRVDGKIEYQIQTGISSGQYTCVFYVENGNGNYFSVPEGDLDYILFVT